MRRQVRVTGAARPLGSHRRDVASSKIGQGDVGAEPLDQAVAFIAPGSAARRAVDEDEGQGEIMRLAPAPFPNRLTASEKFWAFTRT